MTRARSWRFWLVDRLQWHGETLRSPAIHWMSESFLRALLGHSGCGACMLRKWLFLLTHSIAHVFALFSCAAFAMLVIASLARSQGNYILELFVACTYASLFEYDLALMSQCSSPSDTEHSCLQTVVLPTVVFPGGKTLFEYHLPEKYGTHPYAIHATFQRYNNPGKRSRFREVGALFLLDPLLLLLPLCFHSHLASIQ
jgi:hypothetical protein